MILRSDRTPLVFPRRPSLAGASASVEAFSARSFEWLLERERCLADRNDRTFGLLVLEFARRDAGGDAFAARLHDELRSTDVVGRLDRHRIGILLPDADTHGLLGAEARICALASSLGFPFEAKSYAYPDAGSGAERPKKPAKSAPIPRAPTQDLWPVLAPPAPRWKRALDAVLAGAGLLALLPFFALVAALIRIGSPGPVLFRQKRVGLGGRLFVLYKFRSMYVDAEARRTELESRNEQKGPIFKMRRDPRVTPLGRFLRRASIDELPQLWNVLVGDLSLVGPRPPTPDEAAHYELWQRRRLSVPAGLTCLWQVSGRSDVGFEDWMRLDMRYVARRGFWNDLVLLARTLPAVISGRGAY